MKSHKVVGDHAAKQSFLALMIKLISGNAIDANHFDTLMCEIDAYRGAGTTVDAGTLNKTHYTLFYGNAVDAHI